jgi:hypothetical protein
MGARDPAGLGWRCSCAAGGAVAAHAQSPPSDGTFSSDAIWVLDWICLVLEGFPFPRRSRRPFLPPRSETDLELFISLVVSEAGDLILCENLPLVVLGL